jgi:hypothetical protein
MIAASKLQHLMPTPPTFTTQPDDTLRIYFKPIDVEKQWIRCATVSNFVAAYFQDVDRDPALPPIIDTNLLSTVLNELIENAAKYSANREQENELTVHIFKNSLQIAVSNVATAHQAEGVLVQLNTPKTEDELEELYMNKLQDLSENGLSQRSAGLGLLMLQKDYPISLAASFNKELLTVEVTWKISK